MPTIFRTERQVLIFMLVAGAATCALILTGLMPDIG